MSVQKQNLQSSEKETFVYRIVSIPVSVAFILLVYIFNIPNPMMLLIIPVVFFTYLEGFISGGLSAVTALCYSAYFFFIMTADKAATSKVITIILAELVIVGLVGRLKERDNRRYAELKRMQKELVAAKEEAEQLSRVKSNFLSMMSHEIRTPMNAIIGMSGIAAKSDNIQKIKECLSKIDDASEHLLGIINDVLDMSKIEARKFELAPSDFVLENMLKRIVNVNQVRFEEKEQEFSILIGSDVPTAIIADQQRLSQVITNLLSNAAKFTPNGGRISLSIQLVEDTEDMALIRFLVKDEGIGMSEEQKAHIFHAFEQADNSITRRFGGTGLGLSISRNIIEMMGGDIWVESTLGKGSEFIFEIRVKKGAATRSNALNTKIDWQKVRFLAIDASENTRKYFKTIADSLGIICDVTTTADEACSCLKERKYEIVFLDWFLPGDSLALIRRISEMYEDQIIVMMFAGDWSDVETQVREAGATHFISKPLLPSAFVDCINECLGAFKEPVPQLEADREGNRDIFLGRCALLVEDMEINREILKTVLEDTGMEFIEAENGQIAYELFRQEADKIDIIIMDVHMPLMDGYEATRNIRANKHIKEAATVPILAMTADVLPEDIRRCREAGMNDHVGKPINPTELIDKIKRLIPVHFRN